MKNYDTIKKLFKKKKVSSHTSYVAGIHYSITASIHPKKKEIGNGRQRNPTPSHTLSRSTEFPEPPRGNQNPTNAKSRVPQGFFCQSLTVNSMSFGWLYHSPPHSVIIHAHCFNPHSLSLPVFNVQKTPYQNHSQKKWIRIRKVFRFSLMFWPDFLLSDPGPNPEFLRPKAISNNRSRLHRNR